MMTDATRPTDDEVREMTDHAASLRKQAKGRREIAAAGTHSCAQAAEADRLERVADLLDRLSRPAPAKPIAAEPGEVTVIETLARLEEARGNKPGAFTLRNVGIVGTVFEQMADVLRATLTAAEPRAAGEGALADEDGPEEWLSRLIEIAEDSDYSNEYVGAEVRGNWLRHLAALRQPSTERESVREAAEAIRARQALEGTPDCG